MFLSSKLFLQLSSSSLLLNHSSLLLGNCLSLRLLDPGMFLRLKLPLPSNLLPLQLLLLFDKLFLSVSLFDGLLLKLSLKQLLNFLLLLLLHLLNGFLFQLNQC